MSNCGVFYASSCQRLKDTGMAYHELINYALNLCNVPTVEILLHQDIFISLGSKWHIIYLNTIED